VELIKNFYDAERYLHQQAIIATGLTDFGDTTYLEGLRVLLNAYENEAQFNDMGRFAAQNMIVSCLKGRLFTEDGIKKNSQCLQQKMSEPIFIIGLPRTGTSILHRLLAQDNNNQGLEYWLGSYPMPRPPREQWQENLRFQEIKNSLQLMQQINPEIESIHKMRADGVDECRLLLMQSFANVTFSANATIPSYEQWLYNTDFTDVYCQYKRALQLIGSHHASKRWTLKDPSHLWSIDALLEKFPDACIVQTHRDPVKIIASVSSLVYASRKIGEPKISPAQVGQQQLEQWQIVLAKAMKVRENFPGKFYDIYFDDFMDDPIDVVKKLYQHLGRTFSVKTAEHLRNWILDNHQRKHGGHKYSPEDFGLSSSEILDHYSAYQTQFFSSR
tara:strand:- start:698 stop:1858 length:1161 start_codon:yes stop_codon:yes gene_type:complete